MKELKTGETCWHYWRGVVSIVNITAEVQAGGGYYFTFENGFRRGESDYDIDSVFFKMPEDRDALLKEIDRDIDQLRYYRQSVADLREVF